MYFTLGVYMLSVQDGEMDYIHAQKIRCGFI